MQRELGSLLVTSSSWPSDAPADLPYLCRALLCSCEGGVAIRLLGLARESRAYLFWTSRPVTVWQKTKIGTMYMYCIHAQVTDIIIVHIFLASPIFRLVMIITQKMIFMWNKKKNILYLYFKTVCNIMMLPPSSTMPSPVSAAHSFFPGLFKRKKWKSWTKQQQTNVLKTRQLRKLYTGTAFFMWLIVKS